MRRLVRIENLLLLIPFAILLIGVFMAFRNVPYTAEKELMWYVLINIFLLDSIKWLFSLLPGYLIHYFLRIINMRNKIISAAHVLITVVLGIFVTEVGSDLAFSIVPGWHTTIWAPASFAGMAVPWLILLFWLIQMLYFSYGIFIIHRWAKARA